MAEPNLLVSALLAPAEFALNQLVKQDTLLADKLLPFSGSALKVTCSKPEISVFLIIDGTQLLLAQDYSKEVDAVFTGSLPALMSLLLQEHPNLHGSGVDVEGDMQKAQAIQKILSASSIDWEYHFSRLFGDIPTQTVSTFAHKAAESARRNINSLKKNLDEYIHEEARLLPGNEELEIFYSDLDALKLRLDRLQARINSLCA